jgi:prepilin-type N-terminal cleavage/methylation domain-containing protein
MRNRQGFSLAELLVGMVVAGIIAASVVQLMAVQSQFFNRQEGRSSARAVARSATNIMMADLRMLETSSGVVAAAANDITLRVPYAFGIVCGSSGTATTVVLQPIDSVVAAEAGFSGYAALDVNGNYNYAETGTSVTYVASPPALCTTNGITSPGGRAVTVSPPAPGAVVGSPFFLFQRVTYTFGNSVSMPGRIGLFRTIVGRNLTEELVAPFDATARFRFYVAGSTVPQDNPPASLADLRGLELQLFARNERVTSAAAEELAPLTTAVFFKNQ